MSLEYFNDDNFIPVELPERAVHDEGVPDCSHFLSSNSVIQGTLKGDIIQSPHQPHHGSPPYQWSTDPLNSTRSPGSEISFTSDESINIIGDVFSAPTRLRDIMNKFTHIKDAGDQYYWPYLLPTTSLGSSSSGGSDSKEATNSLPVSPSARPPSTPPGLRQNVSSLLSGVTVTPRKSLGSSPLFLGNRPNLSPRGLKNSACQPEGSPNISRHQRRNRYRNREDRIPLAALNPAPSPKITKVSSTGTSQLAVPDMSLMRRQSSPQVATSTLNPFAPSFDPGHLPRPRALSLPEDPASRDVHLNGTFNSFTQPLQEQLTQLSSNIHRQVLQSLPPVAPQKLQTIQQDLPHLREWSNQFGMRSHYAAGNAATRIQVEQHYPSLQRYAFPPVHPMAQGQHPFVHETPPFWVPPNHYGSQYHTPQYSPMQSQPIRPSGIYPSDSIHLLPHDGMTAYNNRPGFVDGLRRTPPRFVPVPLLTPIELPETGSSSNISPSTELARATMVASEHNKPHILVNGISKVETHNFLPLSPPQSGTNGSRFKSASLGPTERGISALTPVTERSEVSSSDLSVKFEVDITNDDDVPRDPGKKKRCNRRSKKPSGMTYMHEQNPRKGDKRSNLF
ncbi:hypothetical protein FRC18_000436 [Serendipita sp. 400]|nr:hypothetical protein FRC18_000436 [Serendipita sp. 400]